MIKDNRLNDENMKNKQRLFSLISTAVITVALIAYAMYVLVGLYSDVLITAQDRNAFSADPLYFSELMSRPFGLFQYVGGYLTQLFYHPALGAAVLVAIWTASAFIGIKAFGLKGVWRSLVIVPVACLMASTVDLGYWVYCLNISGYWFSNSVALLCLVLMLWAANATPRRYRIAWYVIGFCIFPFFGWFSYLFAICLAISQFGSKDGKHSFPSWMDIVGVALAGVAPLIFHALMYEGIVDADVYHAGFPLFRTSTNASMRPCIPFFIMSASLLILALGRILPAVKKVPAFVACLVVGAGSAYAVWSTAFLDSNYIYEMQMTQATMRDDWNGVVSVAEKTKTPSRAMVVLKNIALMNTGELGQRSFELGNSGVEINNPDSLDVNTMQIACSAIYYNYGLVNYSLRWCMEFGVQYGFSPYIMKNIVRCATATGEKNLAARYTDRMSGLMFYGDWKPAPVSKVVKELQTAFPDVLSSDENSCERYIITLFGMSQKPDSKLIRELNLLYSMILRDPEKFSYAFYMYAKSCEEDYVPKAYEEAYQLFSDKRPEFFPYRVRITEETKADYAAFWDAGNRYAGYGYDEDGVSEMMRDDWGGSYWWFNAFGRREY